MKKSIAITLLITCVIVSCRKEEECTTKAYKEPCYIAFRGFQISELDTLIQKTYKPGTNFSQLLSTDTLTFPDVAIIDRIAYSSPDKTYMTLVSPDADCEFLFPARRFKLSSLVYSADSVVRWTSKHGCVATASYKSQPWYVSVDGGFQATATLVNNNTRWIVLDK